MREVNTFGRYLRQKYALKVSKVPISLPGFTCPNIDGFVAKGGCIYCDNESFSPNFLKSANAKVNFLTNEILDLQLESLKTQYEKTSNKLKNKFGSTAFLVYFQSFSNTYAPIESLKKLYETALSFEDSIGISIGTRSDCVQDELYEYLGGIAAKKEVWLEFGVQSVFDTTLKTLNRAHSFKSVEDAVKKAKRHNIKVCAHLIFGLPGEDARMCLQSVKKVAELGVDSIKFHPLYVTQNTALANLYKKQTWAPLTQEQYLEILKDAILMLPQNVSVGRVCAGDTTLIAPDWCADKNSQMRAIREYLSLFELKL